MTDHIDWVWWLYEGRLLFVSLLSHFWLIHFLPPIPAISTTSRPLSSSMCSITLETTNVGCSYNRMRGPGIGCRFSDRSNYSHWSLTLTVYRPVRIFYTTLSLSPVRIQLCSPSYWHLDSNYWRTRCRQSQLRFVLSSLLLHPSSSTYIGNNMADEETWDTEARAPTASVLS